MVAAESHIHRTGILYNSAWLPTPEQFGTMQVNTSEDVTSGGGPPKMDVIKGKVLAIFNPALARYR